MENQNMKEDIQNLLQWLNIRYIKICKLYMRTEN